MLELVEVEGYALPLARKLVTGALAGPVIPVTLRLGTVRATDGAHPGAPLFSTAHATLTSRRVPVTLASSGPKVLLSPVLG